MIVNISTDYLLMKFYGVAGISLSTSVVYWFSFSMLFISLLFIFASKKRLSNR
jgi:Na+-driven multidrug efflux pump